MILRNGKYWAWMKAGLLGLMLAVLSGCGLMSVTDEQGRVYHCVATAKPVPPTDAKSTPWPLELFEYGTYVVANKPTTGRSGYCNIMSLPATAYIRYRVGDKVVEKRFDLSSLTPRRVHDKTVEFYVDGEMVEVRLVTLMPGSISTKEVITKQ